MRTLPLLLTLSLMLAPLAAHAQANKKKLVCWTDEHGQRACGDRVPPQYAKQERQVINERGQVVETRPRQLTAEEAAAAEARRKADAEAKKRAEEQAAYDRFLIQTYGSVEELEGVRDARIATLQGRLGLAEKAVADNEKTLMDLKGRVAAVEKAEKKPDPKLLTQIRDFEESLISNLRAVSALKTERDEVNARFAQDIERYKLLRAGG